MREGEVSLLNPLEVEPVLADREPVVGAGCTWQYNFKHILSFP